MQKKIIFNEVDHIYMVDGKVYPSVTQIIPKINLFQSEEYLQALAEEGKENHQKIKDFLDSKKIEENNYIATFRRFLEENQNVLGRIITYEKPYFSNHGFCGTPDIIFENAIVDLKRSYISKRYHALQTAGYNLLTKENEIIKSTKLQLILTIDEKIGKYQLHNVYVNQAEAIFISLLQNYKINKLYENYMMG